MLHWAIIFIIVPIGAFADSICDLRNCTAIAIKDKHIKITMIPHVVPVRANGNIIFKGQHLRQMHIVDNDESDLQIYSSGDCRIKCNHKARIVHKSYFGINENIIIVVIAVLTIIAILLICAIVGMCAKLRSAQMTVIDDEDIEMQERQMCRYSSVPSVAESSDSTADVER